MSRKGITPVIGAVLLIGISVAASVSAFTFLQDVQSSIKENQEEKLSDREQELKKSLNMEFVYNGSSGYTLVSVRNTGEIALNPISDGEKIWSMFTDGSPAEWELDDGSSYDATGTVSIDPQATITLNTTEKYPPSGEQKVIEISGDHVSDTVVCFHTGSQSCHR